MAVVKANAYGHGIIPVAQSVIKNGSAQYLGVAIVEEGIELRNAGITVPIHVFTAPVKEQLGLYVKYNLEPTICDISTARKLHSLRNDLGRHPGAN